MIDDLFPTPKEREMTVLYKAEMQKKKKKKPKQLKITQCT